VRPKKYRKSRNKELDRAVRSVDDLRAFDEFRDLVLPALRADVSSGLTADQILAKYTAIAAARLVSEMTKDKGAEAAKEILNRQLGKPVERKQLTHRLDGADEADVDALLISRLKEVTGDGEE
jgi:hypothetical protein